MIKQKVNFFRPLYWFCLIPFWFALRSALYFSFVNLGLNTVIPFSASIATFLIFLFYPIYLKFTRQSFSIKFEKINILLIFKCLCAVLLLYFITSYLKYYTMNDLVYVFKSFKYMSRSNIFTKPVLPGGAVPLNMLLIGPICEELLFRRVVYNSMKQQANSIPIAIVYSSIIFSLIHYNYPDYNMLSFIVLFLDGLVFSYCYEKTHNILSSIILHSLVNLFLYFTYGLNFHYMLLYYIVLCTVGLIVLVVLLIVFLVKRKRNSKLAVVAEESALGAETAMIQCSEVEL